MARDHRLDFGILIGIHRERLGKTQTALGSACGTTQTKYSDWERCKALPEDAAQVATIARELEIDAVLLAEVWDNATRDTVSKGAAIITRAYNVTSDGGGTSSDPY